MRTFWACSHPLAYYPSNQDYMDNQPDKMNPQAGTMNPMNLGWKYFSEFLQSMHSDVKARKPRSSAPKRTKMIAAVQFHSLVCHTPVTHWEPVPGLGAKARDSSLAASTGTSGSVSDLRRQPGTQSNLKGILCSYSIVLSATYQQLFSEIIS